MIRWNEEEIELKVKEAIEKLDEFLSGEKDAVVTHKTHVDIDARVVELKVNIIWVRYLMEMFQTPPIQGASVEGVYRRYAGFIEVLGDLIQIYLNIESP